MTPREAAVLNALLAFDFPGVEELRAQVGSLEVRRDCPCGCGTLDLYPARHVLISSAVNPVEVSGDILDADGTAMGGVILFVHDGLLSRLEVYSYGPPLPIPAPEMIEWHR